MTDRLAPISAATKSGGPEQRSQRTSGVTRRHRRGFDWHGRRIGTCLVRKKRRRHFSNPLKPKEAKPVLNRRRSVAFMAHAVRAFLAVQINNGVSLVRRWLGRLHERRK